ncbi:MAG TPA: dienelactone hydrolase family protein [Thermomicrobiales bacterium]|nr:dienelactone hydrolase family protein [Thermomicrobiales bacterium]
MGEMVNFAANGGACPGYLATAGAAGAPGVVVIQEYWGLNHHIKDVVDRFAAAGYTALAPDLYHGTVATEPDEAGKEMMALNIGQAATDMRGAIAHLRGLIGKRVGVVGFCMGGALSLYAAGDNPDAVGACVDYYGFHPNVPYDLAALRAPLRGFFAGQDHSYASPQYVHDLDTRLTALGKAHDFTTYPDCDHAFFNDDRPEVYNAAAARDTWQKMLDFFGQHLR